LDRRHFGPAGCRDDEAERFGRAAKGDLAHEVLAPGLLVVDEERLLEGERRSSLLGERAREKAAARLRAFDTQRERGDGERDERGEGERRLGRRRHGLLPEPYLSRTYATTLWISRSSSWLRNAAMAVPGTPFATLARSTPSGFERRRGSLKSAANLPSRPRPSTWWHVTQ
jgi:hypothetical protein